MIEPIEINILGQKIELIDTSTAGEGIEINDGKLFIGGIDASEVGADIAKKDATITKWTNLANGLSDQLGKANEQLERLKSAGQDARPIEPTILEEQMASDVRSPSLSGEKIEGQRSQQPSAESNFLLVITSNSVIVNTKKTIEAVEKLPAGPYNLALYHRNSYWATVAQFDSQSAANQALQFILPRWSDAYVVNVAKWCPNAKIVEKQNSGLVGQFDCGF